MLEWLTRHRVTGYLLVNAALLIAVVIMATLDHAPLGRAAYVVAMIALCSAPLLLLETINGRFALLAIFMLLYFCFFGLLDLLTLLFGGLFPPVAALDFMSTAEIGILIGGVAAVAGYAVGATLGRTSRTADPATDWPRRTVLVMGMLLWSVGTAAIIYYQVFVAPEKSNVSVKHGLEQMGPMLTFVVMLGNLVQPLGVLILAYGYARFRSLTWQALIIAVVVAQIGVGFVTDIKGVAVVVGVLVIVVKTLLDNKLPKAWLAGGALFVIFVFPVFQAYRAEVSGERGLNREQALQNISKMISLAIASRDKVMDPERAERSQNFVERLSSKGNVELIFARVGVDVPQLGGQSLVAIPLAFVPRLLMPDKPDAPVGQMFAKVFLKSDSDVYISLSYLGELYWNFGWAGVLGGMTFYGLLLGVIGARSDLSQSISVTRLLVLAATAQGLCMGFGGGLATSSVSWMRSLAAIGILHLLLARKRSGVPEPESRAAPERAPLIPVPSIARFPNVLR